jgi:hypothetical protein
MATEIEVLKICPYCNEPIQIEEVRIIVPENCEKDVCYTGEFHRDCGIEHEVGEDGFLFEENVTRIFAIFKNVLTSWSSPAMVRDYMLPQINAETEKLSRGVQAWLDKENAKQPLLPPGEAL